MGSWSSTRFKSRRKELREPIFWQAADVALRPVECVGLIRHGVLPELNARPGRQDLLAGTQAPRSAHTMAGAKLSKHEWP